MPWLKSSKKVAFGSIVSTSIETVMLEDGSEAKFALGVQAVTVVAVLVEGATVVGSRDNEGEFVGKLAGDNLGGLDVGGNEEDDEDGGMVVVIGVGDGAPVAAELVIGAEVGAPLGNDVGADKGSRNVVGWGVTAAGVEGALLYDSDMLMDMESSIRSRRSLVGGTKHTRRGTG